jgi:two-component system nitrogen regulation sensor histidine kinase NtrY
VEVVELALDILMKIILFLKAMEEEIISKMDRTQLIRIITNLVKNAIQSIPLEQKIKSILVSVQKRKQCTNLGKRQWYWYRRT